jgi:hypothetical protein
MNQLLQKEKHEKRTFYEFFQLKLGFGFIWSFDANSRDRLPAYYLWKVNTSCTENYYIPCLWKEIKKSLEFAVSIHQYSKT